MRKAKALERASLAARRLENRVGRSAENFDGCAARRRARIDVVPILFQGAFVTHPTGRLIVRTLEGKSSVGHRTLRPIIAALGLIGILLACNSALAEGYGFDFGADTDRAGMRARLTGSLAKDALGQKISLLISCRDHTALVRLNGADVGCCYFTYAKEYSLSFLQQ